MVSQPEHRGGGGHVAAQAVVFEQPQAVSVRQLDLTPPDRGQVVVDVEWSGISTGTEKLLWSGAMPPFPGMGYPLVPGYETVGRVADVNSTQRFKAGQRVFVSGASCFGDIRGLFGGASSRLVVNEDKLIVVDETLEQDAILLALAATAHHALFDGNRAALPDLIIGHGVLGRLLARLTTALGGAAPTVWETNERRQSGATDYPVVSPSDDDRKDYTRVVDASGDPRVIDTVVQHLARHGEIVLAGFYAQPLSFTFPPAFMREARLRIAAEWQPGDLRQVRSLINTGALSLANLITHTSKASEAESAYPLAFNDPDCLKMVLDWRS